MCNKQKFGCGLLLVYKLPYHTVNIQFINILLAVIQFKIEVNYEICNNKKTATQEKNMLKIERKHNQGIAPVEK